MQKVKAGIEEPLELSISSALVGKWINGVGIKALEEI